MDCQLEQLVAFISVDKLLFIGYIWLKLNIVKTNYAALSDKRVYLLLK